MVYIYLLNGLEPIPGNAKAAADRNPATRKLVPAGFPQEPAMLGGALFLRNDRGQSKLLSYEQASEPARVEAAITGLQ